jgi:DNA-binding MarR family transcriptional regulator
MTPPNGGALRQQLDALQVVRKIDPDMPTQTFAALLFIAINPGCSQLQMLKALKLSTSTATRISARLGEWERYGKAGLRLVTQEQNPQDRRERQLYLTPAGTRLVQEVVQCFK